MASKSRIGPDLTSRPTKSFSDKWHLIGLLDGGRRVALGGVVGGGCNGFLGVYLKETPKTVTVDLRSVSSGASVCPDNLISVIGYVQLAEPLGTRRLVD